MNILKISVFKVFIGNKRVYKYLKSKLLVFKGLINVK